ncbi:Beta-lactamase domain-containing protein 2 [Cladobotryum mycophilum]|uniref:Beta-lactamase domain-containing protein 2 n=1 Tax=Cladobotryum mycophilum TaxID=491253 RepID=A0ABR0SC29_9HYPO
MAQIHGICDSRFDEVRALLQQHIESGEELGASITVNIDGQNVVDIWGGYADEARTQPWESDTIVNVFSSTKTVASFALLMLIDRGLVDVDGKISQYWPEFAVNGKENIEIRHLLSHSTGLGGWDEKFHMDVLCDHEQIAAKLAQQAPWWEPGTASAYHALTFGVLVGEIVQRVTGKPLKRFVAEEISGPLDADFQIGALEKDWPRISDIVPAEGVDEILRSLPQGSMIARIMDNPAIHPNFFNSAAARSADMGSINGHGNSRSLARILSAISLGGEVDGTRLLSQKTIDKIFEEQINGEDLFFASHLRWGTGFALSDSGFLSWLPAGKMATWGGWGGSLAIMDVERRVTFTYVMNKMAPEVYGSGRGISYVTATFNALGA